ncbi:molybdate ABC transporter permease subunit [Flavobacteriales bacterium]|nr:molybdate ABC transporter permease subunit [Flavobacteriales bacterium]
MLDWSPIILTLQLALITTVILFVISIPLAYWMANTKSRIKPIIEAIVSLPLVLPPTVLGFYLLIAFSPESAIGSFLNDVFGLKLAFSFTGLVIGSTIYSLPFMVQPLQAGFASLPSSFSEASFVLGKSKYQTITKVLIPNIKKSILTGIVLTFAHTVGEFGVVLMIGGNIPNQTKVVSIAIYDEVESLNYSTAHIYSGVLLTVTFAILLLVYINNNSSNKFSR